MQRGDIRVLELSGSHHDVGLAHGQAHSDEINRYARERIELVCSGLWSKGALAEAEVLAIAERCLPAHEQYSPELFNELEGLASATGLSLAELIVVGGFTDFVDAVYAEVGHHALQEDDCTAMLVPDSLAGGAGFLAQTWDMHDTAAQHVVLLDVSATGSPRSMVFTTTGCLGQMGMNEAGICVGINNLAAADGGVGVTWPTVVRKALMQDNIDDALSAITDAELAGAHNYLLFDRHGNGYNIEAFTTVSHITKLQDKVLAHTNHCLVGETLSKAQPRPTELQATSEARLQTALDRFHAPSADDASENITFDDIAELTRHPTICYSGTEPFHVETCGAAIMRPESGDFWACWGQPSENPYERFSLL